MDRITGLSDELITLVLEKLSFIDRVKTSALSRSWRFRWTSVPSLPLDMQFYVHICKSSDPDPTEYLNIVNSLVLQVGSCVEELSLFVPDKYPAGSSLFQHPIRYLAKNGVKRLDMQGDGDGEKTLYNLPSAAFYSANLRELDLFRIHLCIPPWFQGFPNLTRFNLCSDSSSADVIQHFVAVCPRLEKLGLHDLVFDSSTDGSLHLVAPKLTSLSVGQCTYISISNGEILESIYLSSWNDYGADTELNKFGFFNIATRLKEITMDAGLCEFLGRCYVIDNLPIFHQMKILKFYFVDLNNVHVIKCLLSFCTRSPIITELALRLRCYWGALEEDEQQQVEAMCEKYIKNEFRHLASIDIDIKGTKVEMKLIELFLRFSPVLEVVCVFIPDDVKVVLIEVIQNFYRASNKVRFEFR